MWWQNSCWTFPANTTACAMIKAGASHSVYFTLFCPIRPDTAIRLAPTHTVRVCRHGAGSFLPCWWKSEAPSSCQRMIHAWNGLVRHILCLPTHVCRLILTGRDCRRNRQKLFDIGTRQEHVVASALSNALRTGHLLARKRPRWMPAGLAVSAVPRVFRVLSRLAELPFGHLGGTKARYTTGGGLVYMGTRTYLELLWILE
jgi:hypothetical protein